MSEALKYLEALIAIAKVSPNPITVNELELLKSLMERKC